MISEKTKTGARVRVRADHRRPEFRGRRGTVVRLYGPPGRAALEVRFEDGVSQLFWRHDLDEAPEDVPAAGGRWRRVPRWGRRVSGHR